VVSFSITDLTLMIRRLFFGAHVNGLPLLGNAEGTLLIKE
jgi:hypothetical protein